jgi:hypothetical protein
MNHGTDTRSDPPFSDTTKVKIPVSMFFGVLIAVAGAAVAWASTWSSLKADVSAQGRELQSLRINTGEAISDLRREQSAQHDILIRVDQNVKMLRQP